MTSVDTGTPTRDGRVRLAVDIGGTFTDVVAVRHGEVAATKILSTTDDLSVGVVAGIEAALSRLGALWQDIAFVVHATTAATNALLEGQGARVGLIVTDGFRDILEIGRQRRYDPYDLRRPKLAAIVPRDMVVEVPERVDARGEPLLDLNEDAVTEAGRHLRARGAEVLAVSFIHAYRNPRHEQRARALLGDVVPVFVSHEIVPEAREYERTSTTVIAAYLAPAVRRYLEALARRIGEAGASRRFWVMKSSGGLFPSEAAERHPEELVESGPAAGVIGAAAVAGELGITNIISFDMGGTTAKASLIRDGLPQLNYEYEVGGAAHAGGFLQKGTGYPLRVPVIDLAEVGTGGGSIAWIDRGGALRVGPRSAGANPGPVCYGRGGTEPTVTDADLVLGFLDAAASARYLGRLDLCAARESIERRIAKPLAMSVERAAQGIFDLATAQMADAVRLVSVARGFDPRDLALVAFGGAGPVHAWAIARDLAIRRVLVPPYPGVYSAIGLLGADFRLDLSRGIRIALDAHGSRRELQVIFEELETEALAAMRQQGHAPELVVRSRSADMRYVGQSYEVNVIFPGSGHLEGMACERAFHAGHARVYGHANDGEPVEVITARVTARVPGTRLTFARGGDPADRSGPPTRTVYFDGTGLETRVVSRAAIEADGIEGPATIEQADTTTVVPPGARARPMNRAFLTVEVGGGS